jgi:hypothetical protein
MLLAYRALVEAGAGIEQLPSLNDEVDGWWNVWAYHALTNEIVLFSNIEGWRGGEVQKHFVFHNLGADKYGGKLPSFMKIQLRDTRPYIRYYELSPSQAEFDKYILKYDDQYIYIKVPEHSMARFVGWNNLAEDGILKIRNYQLDEDKKKRILKLISGS